MKREINQLFQNQWIAKKSRRLIGVGGKKISPVFYCDLIQFIDHECLLFWFDFKLRVRCKQSNIGSIYEVISANEALRYAKLWHDSSVISPNLPSERVHLREDDQPKRQFRLDDFQPALYALKCKYPAQNCMAYVCSECGAIHLGKM